MSTSADQNRQQGTILCTRRIEWDAMHRLPDHEGPCRAFHGHRYAAEISCRGEIGEDGMVIDFGLIKREVGAWIDEHWDHTALLHEGDDDPAVEAIERSNRQLGRPVYYMDRPPTAENIAAELAEVSRKLLEPHGIRVARVVVWETPNCSASWSAI